MGYETIFDGSFSLNKRLTKARAAYLKKFSDSRRVKRDEMITSYLPDPIREAVKLPIGFEGEYYVNGGINADDVTGVIDGNKPPDTQPSLYCDWVPSKDRLHIVHNGSEKFYNYIEWIEYIVNNFLGPWGYKVNGSVNWRGEEPGDEGTIFVYNNEVYYLEREHDNKWKRQWM